MGVLEDFWPITCNLQLIQSPTEAVANGIGELWNESAKRWASGFNFMTPATRQEPRLAPSFSVKNLGAQGIQSCLESLLPLDGGTKAVVVPGARGDWSGFWNNSAGCQGDRGLMANLSKKIRTRTLYSLVWPDTISRLPSGGWTGAWGAVQMFVFDGSDTPSRVIAATNDSGRWVFHNEGTPFLFEDTDRYSRRKIKSRFDERLLRHYLEMLSCDGYEDGFWGVPNGRPAYLIERHDSDPLVAQKFGKTVTLRETASRFRGRIGQSDAPSNSINPPPR